MEQDCAENHVNLVNPVKVIAGELTRTLPKLFLSCSRCFHSLTPTGETEKRRCDFSFLSLRSTLPLSVHLSYARRDR